MKLDNAVFLDFEFNRTTNEFVNLVSCVTYSDTTKRIKKHWLHNDKKAQKELKEYLESFKTIVAYAAVAEARAMESLGIDNLQFNWIDLFFEFRCVSNNNYELIYGKHLIDGKEVYISPPPPRSYHIEDVTRIKLDHSLSEASWILLKEKVDTKHKELMRNLIISDPEEFAAQDIKAILSYNESDVLNLPKIFEAIVKNYKSLIHTQEYNEFSLREEMYSRGRYAVHTAYMESRGYPIDYESTKNFSESIPLIMYECQRHINELFPEVNPFRWDKRAGEFKWNQNKTREWIKSCPYADNWDLTDTGQISLSLDSFTKFYSFSHDYPTDNFGAQMVRFLKLKQSLAGFKNKVKAGKKTFWDSVGPDKKVRSYLNPFGAQTSRNQPSATSFIFLKPAWMRALVIPDEGYAMGGIDFASQEFLVSALLSEDQSMIDAYASGDVYFAFAKQAGIVPQDAKRKDFEEERNYCKSCLLEGTLVRVNGLGFIPIEQVKEGQQVWDGQTFRTCGGAKYMGIKPVIEVNKTMLTEDHLIMLEDFSYVESGKAAIKETGKRKVCEKTFRGLQGHCLSWAEIWKVGNLLCRTLIQRATSILQSKMQTR